MLNKRFLNLIKNVRNQSHKKVEELEARIKQLEETVFALKSNVKEQKKQVEIQQKKKWLNGYPDQTEGN